jgi:hypothetical protein
MARIKDLIYLSKGPKEVGLQYQGFMVNGFRFHIKKVERKRKTHNSGVSINTITSSFSSIGNENPILSGVAYFGVLKNVIELDYEGVEELYCLNVIGCQMVRG